MAVHLSAARAALSILTHPIHALFARWIIIVRASPRIRARPAPRALQHILNAFLPNFLPAGSTRNLHILLPNSLPASSTSSLANLALTPSTSQTSPPPSRPVSVLSALSLPVRPAKPMEYLTLIL